MPLALKFSGGLIALTVLILSAGSYVFGGGGDAEPSIDQPDSAQLDEPDAPDADAPAPQGPGNATGAGNATGDSPPYTVQSMDTLGTLTVHVSIAPSTQAAWISSLLRLGTLASAPGVQSVREPVLPAIGSSEALAVAAPPAPDNSVQPAESPLPLPETNQVDVTPAPTSTPAGRTYTVMAGDNAASIAAKHCAMNPQEWIKELLRVNDVDEEGLRASMVLELPKATPLVCSAPTPGTRSPRLAPVVTAATPTPTPATGP
jgi:hypothetical protein